MARPSEMEIGNQEPEPSTKTTLEKAPDKTARRESYIAGEPDSAPELVRFMGCKTIADIDNLEPEDLLAAATQASQTVSGWEMTIMALNERIDALEKQNETQQKIIEYLEQRRGTSTPSPAPTSSKSTKIPDPDQFSDGKSPTYESWKIQIEGKLTANQDHFPSEQTKMIYIFGRTTGDAQKALKTRYGTTKNPFQTAQDMIDHLSQIYIDPYKVENAREDYRRLNMKPSQTFTEFFTTFLQLTGDAEIPQDDWRSDLYRKLTIDIRRAILPIYATLTDYQALADRCRQVDQDLKRLKETSDRLKARQTAASTGNRNQTKPAEQSIPITTKPSTPASINPISSKPRPTYDTSEKQALSRAGACFKCHKPGHMARDCPIKVDNNVIEENEESGKDEP
jgi:Zinc knuckle.